MPQLHLLYGGLAGQSDLLRDFEYASQSCIRAGAIRVVMFRFLNGSSCFIYLPVFLQKQCGVELGGEITPCQGATEKLLADWGPRTPRAFPYSVGPLDPLTSFCPWGSAVPRRSTNIVSISLPSQASSFARRPLH